MLMRQSFTTTDETVHPDAVFEVEEYYVKKGMGAKIVVQGYKNMEAYLAGKPLPDPTARMKFDLNSEQYSSSVPSEVESDIKALAWNIVRQMPGVGGGQPFFADAVAVALPEQ